MHIRTNITLYTTHSQKVYYRNIESLDTLLNKKISRVTQWSSFYSQLVSSEKKCNEEVIFLRHSNMYIY